MVYLNEYEKMAGTAIIVTEFHVANSDDGWFVNVKRFASLKNYILPFWNPKPMEEVLAFLGHDLNNIN